MYCTAFAKRSKVSPHPRLLFHHHRLPTSLAHPFGCNTLPPTLIISVSFAIQSHLVPSTSVSWGVSSRCVSGLTADWAKPVPLTGALKDPHEFGRGATRRTKRASKQETSCSIGMQCVPNQEVSLQWRAPQMLDMCRIWLRLRVCPI
jgi:hypothetical protein